MTIHKSKGLEFSVVVMMELARQFRMPTDGEIIRMDAQTGVALKRCDDVSRVTGHTVAGKALACKKAREIRSEEARLLYVGMTRAKDRLILLSSPKSLDAARTVWGLPTGDYAAGCARCMLDWIGQAVGEGLQVGHDTLFTARNGSEWDLRYHAPSDFRQALPGEKPFVAPDLSGDIDPRVRGWMERTWPRRHVQKTSVTALLRGGMWLNDEEETPETKRRALHLDTLPPELPAFLREETLSAADRGTAAHKALGALDIDALRGLSGPALIDAAKNNLLKLYNNGILSKEEYSVIDMSDVVGFLVSSLGRRMLASPEVKREWGFCLMHEGVLIQGILDLCFFEDGAWVLVDYKTDRCDADELKQRYREQLTWYARALRDITGRPVREIFLYALRQGRALEISL